MTTRRSIYSEVVIDTNQLRNYEGFDQTPDDLAFFGGEEIIWNIDFKKTGSGGLSSFIFAETDVFTLMVKKVGNYDGNALVLSEASRWNQSGDRSDLDIADGKTSVRVNFNTDRMADALGSSTESVNVLLEIQVQTPDAEPTKLLQTIITVSNRVIRGDEGDDPESPDPTLANQAYVDAAVETLKNTFFHIDENGDHWLKNKDGEPVMKVE